MSVEFWTIIQDTQLLVLQIIRYHSLVKRFHKEHLFRHQCVLFQKSVTNSHAKACTNINDPCLSYKPHTQYRYDVCYFAAELYSFQTCHIDLVSVDAVYQNKYDRQPLETCTCNVAIIIMCTISLLHSFCYLLQRSWRKLENLGESLKEIYQLLTSETN